MTAPAHKISVHDALHEAAVTFPGSTAPQALRAALRSIPDMYYVSQGTIRERFVAAVIANARAIGRSPYTVALFALDT